MEASKRRWSWTLLAIFLAFSWKYWTNLSKDEQETIGFGSKGARQALRKAARGVAWRPTGRGKEAWESSTFRNQKEGKRVCPTMERSMNVLVVPGFTSTPLEVWKSKDCAKLEPGTRRRLWGDASAAQAFLIDRSCWLEHMSLDPISGIDPEEMEVRSVSGLAAIESLIGGYEVWARITRAWIASGYRADMLSALNFDWRLAPEALERRDAYFSRMRSRIESLADRRPTAVVTHSYGSLLFLAFLKWIESPIRQPGWTERNVKAWINLAGPIFGVPKALSALLSGEMKDSAIMGELGVFLSNAVVPSQERAKLFRTWGSLLTMLPRPDDRAWSKQNGQKDPMIHFAREEDFRSAEGALRLLWNITGNEYAERAWKNRWAFRPRNHAKQSSPSTEEMEDDGPFDIKLPYAPSMQVYCLYGVGKATEKGYEYMWQPNNKEQPLRINTSAHDPSIQLQNGVYLGDGDGTVPLMSLGYMCNKGWRSARYNPAGIRIVTREYQHNPVHFLQDLRGGPLSGDHVDILLNEEMIDDLLTITGGDGDQLQDAIYSEIRELSQGFEL